MNKPPKTKYFLYARKSSEAEDRQVASIDAQVKELTKLANDNDLEILDVLTESQSAKAPGRPVFNNMLMRIAQGDAQGIVCWKLDRLARNPIDGGQINWMLQQGNIQHIQTYGRSYYPTDNVLMMSVELGMANQFIRDLSVNVKRGLKKKLEDGDPIGLVPEGYMNTPDREKGTRIAVKDPVRFPMVRRMWDLMLTGHYNPQEILRIINKEGYQTVQRRKIGGKSLSRSAIYRMFNNYFYMGMIECPRGSGNFYQGNHEPLVTRKEFDRVQFLLGRKGIRTNPKFKEFAFTGIMRCGECGCSITAEQKDQIFCTRCKKKFCYENKTECPNCHLEIAEMRNPKQIHYVYYHCTKKKGPCSQACIRVEELERQITEFLSRIHINQKYLDWAIKHLQDQHQEVSEFRRAAIESKQSAYNAVVKQIDKLLEMRLREEITEAEYSAKKGALSNEKQRLQELLRDSDDEQNKGIVRAEQTFNFARTAREEFETAAFLRKREMLLTLGSNLILLNKNLQITAEKPFEVLEKALVEIPEASARLEPEIHSINKRQTASFDKVCPLWLGSWDSNPGPTG